MEATDIVVSSIHEDAKERGVPSTIQPAEAVELRLYFKACGSAVDVSPMGQQLARTALYAFRARPCKHCGGDLENLVGGCGWMPSKVDRREPSTSELALLKWEKKLNRRKVTLPPRADTPCLSCDGRGWVIGVARHNWRTLKMFWVSRRYINGTRGPLEWHGPYLHAQAEQVFEEFSCIYDDVSIAKARPEQVETTARPTGSSVPHGSVPSNDGLLHRFAVIARRLDEMASRWLLSVDVLDTYYGQDGGVIQALWPLTPAGKTLLRRNKLDLHPLQFYENERRDQSEKRDPQRRILFNAADSQSRALLAGASALWNLISDDDLSTLVEERTTD